MSFSTAKHSLSFVPSFRPPIWLRNPHLQTILPKFVAPSAPMYRRKLVLDSLKQNPIAYDFVDAYPSTQSKNNALQSSASSELDKTPIIVMFHGMEGSSQSHYARSAAHVVHAKNWHFMVAHMRGCGEVPIDGDRFYEAGDTNEIHHTLNYLAKNYQTIYAIGISLGGSMLAKYLGEYGSEAICAAACVVSSPLDLASSAIALESFIGRKVYSPYLLNPLANKALQQHLTDDEIRAIKASKSIGEFDEIFTAPRHGYRSKNDYYHKASAMPYLYQIKTPTLIITAQDDPFVGTRPTQADVSSEVNLYEPKYGGHIGFLSWHDKRLDSTWFIQTAIRFFQSI